MKHELKISTIATICVLCTAFSAYGASSVRVLGGAGTYNSAASAAGATSGATSGATATKPSATISGLRGGSVRVTPSSGATGTVVKPTAGTTTGTRGSAAPRLSIGKYLGGGTAVSGSVAVRPQGGGSGDAFDGTDIGSAAELNTRLNVIEGRVEAVETDSSDASQRLDAIESLNPTGESFSPVAFSGSYEDLEDKPVYEVDTELSEVSGNAIANAAVTKALNEKQDKFETATDANYDTAADTAYPTVGAVKYALDEAIINVGGDVGTKLDKNQNATNAGRVMIVGDDGELAPGYVTTDQITDGTIKSADLSSELNTEIAKIADKQDKSNLVGVEGYSAAILDDTKYPTVRAVETAIANKIADALNGSITDVTISEAALATGAVTTDKVGDAAITTIKIADDAVMADKIATGAVTSDAIGAGAVITDAINNGAVTSDKIATGAVTSDKLDDTVSANLLPARTAEMATGDWVMVLQDGKPAWGQLISANGTNVTTTTP